MVNETQTFNEAIGLVKGTGIFDVLLPFLVVFAIVYGMLVKTKFLGERQSVNVVVAFVIAMMIALNESARSFLNSLLPSYTVFFIIIIMMVFIFIFFGFSGKNIIRSPPAYLMIFAFLLVLFLVALGSITGDEIQGIGLGSDAISTNETVGDWTKLPWGEQIILGFRDPKVFSMIIMLVIFAVATYAIAKYQ
ncbi:MAG: hypothetical protein PHW96_04090 [Candidatus Nanoarchaeia archaeon]|nr:hypothetical protein [Candidatus Nanoarchaeia archaeon]